MGCANISPQIFPFIPGTLRCHRGLPYSCFSEQSLRSQRCPETSHPLFRWHEAAQDDVWTKQRCLQDWHLSALPLFWLGSEVGLGCSLLCPRKRGPNCWGTRGTLVASVPSRGRGPPHTHLIPAVLLQAVQEAAGIGQPERCHLKVLVALLWKEKGVPGYEEVVPIWSNAYLSWQVHLAFSYPGGPKQARWQAAPYSSRSQGRRPSPWGCLPAPPAPGRMHDPAWRPLISGAHPAGTGWGLGPVGSLTGENWGATGPYSTRSPGPGRRQSMGGPTMNRWVLDKAGP